MSKLNIRYLFIFIGVIIAASFLYISNEMASDLAKEERQKMEIWSDALKLTVDDKNNTDLDLILKILSGNKSIPVILCDDSDNVLMSVNLNVPEEDSVHFFNHRIAVFKRNNKPILINDENFKQTVYYGDSTTLKRLQYYPYIQIGVLTIFICISTLALLSTKNAEQNKVWVGLSKETAHQLGTPISSIMAWMEYLKTKDVDIRIIEDMEKDVSRLNVVTDRFSKIGSKPSPETKEVASEIELSLNYLRNRISKKVEFIFNFPEAPVYAKISSSLFSWVIENLVKNAVDAMSGKGAITISIKEKDESILIDLTDTGKGIPKSKFKEIFKPGFTTKERGWGLGLSLVKRIIEEYHKGKIYVKDSEQNVGTTFRIELKKVV